MIENKSFRIIINILYIIFIRHVTDFWRSSLYIHVARWIDFAQFSLKFCIFSTVQVEYNRYCKYIINCQEIVSSYTLLSFLCLWQDKRKLSTYYDADFYYHGFYLRFHNPIFWDCIIADHACHIHSHHWFRNSIVHFVIYLYYYWYNAERTLPSFSDNLNTLSVIRILHFAMFHTH